MFQRHRVYSVEIQGKTYLKVDLIRVGNAAFSHLLKRPYYKISTYYLYAFAVLLRKFKYSFTARIGKNEI